MEGIRKGTCPRCPHNEIVEGQALEFSGETAYGSTLGIDYGGTPELSKPRGPLLTYACRSCGFTQWFTVNPESIPIDPVNKTRLIKGPAPKGPYR